MSERFHEWPLVAFTALAMVGGGLLASPLLAVVFGTVPWATTPLALRGAVLIAAGMLVSQGHLGRPGRAPLAVAGFGRSRLSVEILLGGAAVVVGVLAAFLVPGSALTAIAAAALAVAFLVSLGLVYSLPGQYWWAGAAVFTPVNLGLAFGTLSLAALSVPSDITRLGGTVLLAVDAVIFVIRSRDLARMPSWFRPVHPDIFELKTRLLAGRLVVVNVLPTIFLLAERPFSAAATLWLGVVIDRVAFYALAAQHSTEGEVESVEGTFSTF